MQITKQDIADPEVVKVLEDSGEFIDHFMHINTESDGVRPFILNEAQRRFHESRNGRRDLILKARRFGFSSYCLGVGLHKAITKEGWNCAILTHTPESRDSLFADLKIMFDNLPEHMKPVAGYNNKTELTFPALSSRMSINSAGAEEGTANAIGRSKKINFLHCSEVALWTHPETTLSAVLPCVPIEGEVILESTANGFNYFYNLYDESKKGEGLFKAHFFPWQEFSQYRLPLLPGEKDVLLSEVHPDRLTDEEKYLMKAYGVKLSQIKWRRYRVKEIGRRKFPQEYPMNDVECFLVSGKSFFNVQKVREKIDNKTLRLPPLKHWKDGTAVPHGWFVYKYPEPGKRYVGGGDTAEGLERGDGDSFSIKEWDTGEEVCVIDGRFGAKAFAKHIRHAFMMYNKAVFTGIERNNHGQTVLSHLVNDEKFPARWLYHHQHWDAERRRAFLRPGWSTDERSRPLMLDEFADAFEHDLARIHHLPTLQQMLTFVVAKDGKPKAQNGAFDDHVISNAICWQLRKFRPFQVRGNNL